MQRTFLIYLLIALTITSCRTIKNSNINNQILSSRCYQQNEYNYTQNDLPSKLTDIKIDTLLSKTISPDNLYIANIIGIIDYLNEYNQIINTKRNDQSSGDRIRILELKQAIDHQINNASLIISAVSSELDCEEERVSQIAQYLSEKQENLESKLTITAIVMGATGAILTGGVIKNDKVSNTVGITTGIAEAAIGLTMLFNKRNIEFYHQRNILRDIWLGPQISKLFPSFIWYYLNNEDEKNQSLRKEIINKWTQFGQIEENSTISAALYFGDGGKYTADDLNNRADMFDQLESHIYLLKQKLMTLTEEIDKIK